MKGIYIHVPFCLKKCNYCDFCSYPDMTDHINEYVLRANSEMEKYKNEKIEADTLYFGGGTPSLLSVEQISNLLKGAKENFKIMPKSEITIEANPCTVNSQKANAWKNMGINRISLGAQTFSDSELKKLGRIHNSEDTKRAFWVLRDAGFDNISLDLMYAIPNQDEKSLKDTLKEFITLSPEHISCYGLKIEEGTPFSNFLEKGEISEKSDEEYENMYHIIKDTLEINGYEQYELSNFSKDGKHSCHNVKYWTGEEYVGIGPGASSLYGGKRYTNTGDFEKYLSSFELSEDVILSKEDLMSEFMFLSLRLTKTGASKTLFRERFGHDIWEVFPDAIKKHLGNGLLKDEGDRYILAQRAYYISNYVLCDFV